MWLDDIKQWTKLNRYEGIKRKAEDRKTWMIMLRQPSVQKMTHDVDDDLFTWITHSDK